MLLAVVAVASGVTISCGSGGIGLYDPGWDAAFLDAASKKDAAPDASDATVDDASSDATDDASDATDAASD